MNDSKDIIKLQSEQLNIGDIVNLVVAANCGAISTFIGTTRDNFEGKKVVKLEYEAYEPMALKELGNVCSKIRSQWDVERIAIYHRLGVVPVTEASVVIAISSSHRQESLQATQFAIEILKKTVPIWKKEIYDNHESQWKENKECSWSTSRDETSLAYANVASANDLLLPNNHKIFPSDANQDENEYRITGKRESFDEPVNSNLVQIRVSTEELNRRINAFIARKREQVNIVNVQEFCSHRARVDEERANSCARVDAILIRRKDSKSHVKVHRVLNPWGPQVTDPSTLQKTARNHSNQSSPTSYLPALEERLATSENHIGVKGPVPKDVYQRLKRIEDRILYLESLSPEYKQFWTADDPYSKLYAGYEKCYPTLSGKQIQEDVDRIWKEAKVTYPNNKKLGSYINEKIKEFQKEFQTRKKSNLWHFFSNLRPEHKLLSHERPIILYLRTFPVLQYYKALFL